MMASNLMIGFANVVSLYTLLIFNSSFLLSLIYTAYFPPWSGGEPQHYDVEEIFLSILVSNYREIRLRKQNFGVFRHLCLLLKYQCHEPIKNTKI